MSEPAVVAVKRRRRASIIERLGDVASPEVMNGLREKVDAYLKEATGGRVHVERVETTSFVTEFVLSSDSLKEPARSSLAGLQKRYLGHGWELLMAEHSIPVSNMPAHTCAPTKTLVVRYNNRSVGRWSFGRLLATFGLLFFVLMVLLFIFYWLLVEIRRGRS